MSAGTCTTAHISSTVTKMTALVLDPLVSWSVESASPRHMSYVQKPLHGTLCARAAAKGKPALPCRCWYENVFAAACCVNVSNVTHVSCSSVDNMLQSLPMEAFGLEGDLHVDDHGMMRFLALGTDGW